MATLSTNYPTLLDWARRLDPDGSNVTADIVEILNENNEVLQDMMFQEGNLPTGHRSTIRTGLPAPTWRKLYGGVQPSKSTTVQVTDSTGMLEAYAEVDKALADLNGNTASFRMSEDKAHIEGMSQEMADTLFYGNESTEPEAFTGLAPRFNSLSAANGDNIIDAGGTGSDNTSIWLVVWGPNSVHGIFPKGSRAGIQRDDKGQVTIENVDGLGGRMEAYRTHYRWDAGLTVKDWRYIVRIANIDVSDLTATAATGANLYDLITQALELPPSLNGGRPVLYASRKLRTFLRRQGRNLPGIQVNFDQGVGKQVVTIDEIPLRRTDAILHTEARVT
jgi:hypothetical protein